MNILFAESVLGQKSISACILRRLSCVYLCILITIYEYVSCQYLRFHFLHIIDTKLQLLHSHSIFLSCSERTYKVGQPNAPPNLSACSPPSSASWQRSPTLILYTEPYLSHRVIHSPCQRHTPNLPPSPDLLQVQKHRA